MMAVGRLLPGLFLLLAAARLTATLDNDSLELAADGEVWLPPVQVMQQYGSVEAAPGGRQPRSATQTVHELHSGPLRVHFEPLLPPELETTAQAALLIQKALPHAADWLSSALKVVPVTGRLRLASDTCTELWPAGAYPNARRCRTAQPVTCLPGVTVPDSQARKTVVCTTANGPCPNATSIDGEGVNADTIVYVTVNNITSCSHTLAQALTCWRDQHDRPIGGTVNLCPSLVETIATDLATVQTVLLHEAIHVLGFSGGMFPFFRDCSNLTVGSDGKLACSPRTPRDSSGTPVHYPWTAANTILRSDSRSFVVTPTVVAKAREHFGCDTIDAVPLEEMGSALTAAQHWEARMFVSETMGPSISPGRGSTYVLSPITLALLVDSGWYGANYASATMPLWGKGLGCGFFDTSQCQISPVGFCATSNQGGCTHDLTEIAACSSTVHTAPCKLFLPVPNGFCGAADDEKRCFVGNTGANGRAQSAAQGQCYPHRCFGGRLYVRPHARQPWQHCKKDSTKITFEGYGGSLACPAPEILCNVSGANRRRVAAVLELVATQPPQSLETLSERELADALSSATGINPDHVNIILFLPTGSTKATLQVEFIEDTDWNVVQKTLLKLNHDKHVYTFNVTSTVVSAAAADSSSNLISSGVFVAIILAGVVILALVAVGWHRLANKSSSVTYFKNWDEEVNSAEFDLFDDKAEEPQVSGALQLPKFGLSSHWRTQLSQSPQITAGDGGRGEARFNSNASSSSRAPLPLFGFVDAEDDDTDFMHSFGYDSLDANRSAERERP